MKPLEKLRRNRTRLITDFMAGKIPDFMERHTRILDDYFRDSFGESSVGPRMGVSGNPYAIIGLGGYGRMEQCIHSDIDLLFLFKKKIPEEAEELIREVVYPLWDTGFDIGYSTRSINDCVTLAEKDIEVLTSLLDARFICGQSLLFSDLVEEFRSRVIEKKTTRIVRRLLEANRMRHERFGDSAFLLEPNLKEGHGGIRDYHTMLWIGRIKSDIREPRELQTHGYLSHGSFDSITRSLSFIWNVRNYLHYLADRKCDQLHLAYQTELAGMMKFTGGNGQQPVEKFLGELHGNMESLAQEYRLFLFEHGYEKSRKRNKTHVDKPEPEGIAVRKDTLCFRSSGRVLNSPELLIKIFEESLRLGIPLSSETKHLITELLDLVDNDFRASPSNVKTFERILSAPNRGPDVLNDMLNTGFLARFIPPFKNIVNRIQYDEYHLYPVDRHLLLTVRELKNFQAHRASSAETLFHRLYRELHNRRLLLWAGLLHDVGKGDPGKGHAKRGAAISRSILGTFGFKQKDIDTVAFLIENHLFLTETATRRDIYDEETAVFCARRIRSIGHLKMLYLLTVADSISTGPKAWNEWTGTLLESLFLKILRIMERGELATSKAVKTAERKKAEILATAETSGDKARLEELFHIMSPRYVIYTPVNDMVDHIGLYRSLGEKPFVWKISGSANSDTRTVTICAPDRPGLFSKIAGTFTLNGIDILDSQIYTWRNNIALDIFQVTPPADRIFEDEKWRQTAETLAAVLSDKMDITQTLKKKISSDTSRPRLTGRPNQIIIDNDASSFFTIIEIYTYDFPGLLFVITDALFRSGLDIRIAKISTKVDQVVDVFYVRDFDGQKVDSPRQEEEIKRTVSAVLPTGLPDTGNSRWVQLQTNGFSSTRQEKNTDET
ncbi:MAG: [protein-PII] uridylyltransferase [Deltaproteobacteria bacterium]|nr:MAG: [protein-PII] uridylyltransferase [Deltaproteobacteria bacterium]